MQHMSNLLLGFKAAATMGVTVAAGQLLEDHAVSLPTVGSVGLIVGTGVWWLSRQFAVEAEDRRKLHDDMSELKKVVYELDCMKCPRTRKDL